MASGSISGYWVDFWSISGLCFDFLHMGGFLTFWMIFSFGLIFGFWFNIWPVGEFLAIGLIFLSISGLSFDFWHVGRFLAFWTIFGFLDDFCHLV